MLTPSALRRVADLLWPDFVECDGVVMLAMEEPSSPVPGVCKTLTEYERFHSHTHVCELFCLDVPSRFDTAWGLDRPDAESPEHVAAWELAKRIGQIWMAKLCADFPQYRFRVYVTRLDDPVVHFHRKRENEASWIADEDAAAKVAAGDLVVLDSAERKSGKG